MKQQSDSPRRSREDQEKWLASQNATIVAVLGQLAKAAPTRTADIRKVGINVVIAKLAGDVKLTERTVESAAMVFAISRNKDDMVPVVQMFHPECCVDVVAKCVEAAREAGYTPLIGRMKWEPSRDYAGPNLLDFVRSQLTTEDWEELEHGSEATVATDEDLFKREPYLHGFWRRCKPSAKKTREDKPTRTSPEPKGALVGNIDDILGGGKPTAPPEPKKPAAVKKGGKKQPTTTPPEPANDLSWLDEPEHAGDPDPSVAAVMAAAGKASRAEITRDDLRQSIRAGKVTMEVARAAAQELRLV